MCHGLELPNPEKKDFTIYIRMIAILGCSGGKYE